MPPSCRSWSLGADQEGDGAGVQVADRREHQGERPLRERRFTTFASQYAYAAETSSQATTISMDPALTQR
jgi:hypothetical protein